MTTLNNIGQDPIRAQGLDIEPSEDFVLTPEVESITQRALAYLDAGYAVHLAGPAGTGKTTLAFHIAAQLGNTITLMHGNDEFGSSDMVGKDAGYKKSTTVDNFIHSVLKTEERLDVNWTDNRLTTACEQGHTLIYDEFNRTKPEANNILLSILEEGILDIPRTGSNGSYVTVDSNFRAILTSNPEEYAGVHKAQDALLDRLITIYIDHYDAETEASIASSKGGVDLRDATKLVDLARLLRDLEGAANRPSIRACIAIAKICSMQGIKVSSKDTAFRALAHDVLLAAVNPTPTSRSVLSAAQLNQLMEAVL